MQLYVGLAVVVTAEGVSKGLIVLAATAVAVGSALQALNELREYEDIYDESKAKQVAGSAVTFFPATVAGGVLSGAVLALVHLATSSAEAIEWARKARDKEPEKWARAVTALVKARNWLIVLAGSLLAILAGALDLAYYIHSH